VEAIATLHELKLLRGKATAVEPNVIALARAWRRDDRSLNGLNHQERNELFGVPRRAETHRDWVVDAASRRLDRLAAYRRHCRLPEAEHRAEFDVSTCLETHAVDAPPAPAAPRKPGRASRPAPVPGRKRGRPPNSAYTEEELQQKRDARVRKQRKADQRHSEQERARIDLLASDADSGHAGGRRGSGLVSLVSCEMSLFYFSL
jgi:hypothetical protein